MKKKVYCKNCKWFKLPSDIFIGYEDCYNSKNIEIEDCPDKKRIYIKKFYDEKNKNNNCKDYKKKWYLFKI